MLGYYLAPTSNRAQLVAQVSAHWSQRINAQRRQIEALRTRIDASLGELARKVGRLQAQTISLNRAGQRVVKTAGMNPEAFKLGSVPPIGGAGTRAAKQEATVGRLQEDLNALADKIHKQGQELHILRDLLIVDEAREKTVPDGQPVSEDQSWISSTFGWRVDPFTGARSLHDGFDFATRSGTKVRSVASGVVTFSDRISGYGLAVKVDHGNGYVTLYGHNRKLLVSVGERVDEGETIARAGSTGRSTGTHVHFEVLKNGQPVDPTRYVYAER